MLIVLTAGCSSNLPSGSTSTPAPGPASEKENSEPKGSEEPVTIKFYYYYSEEEMQWDKLHAAFQEEYPNIHVEPVQLVNNVSSPDFMKKLDLLASSGDELGVIYLPTASDYAKYQGLGLLEPLNTYMEEEGLDYSETYNADLMIDGTHYGIPASTSTFFTLINQDHLEEANLDIPANDWTWETYREYANKLTKVDGSSKRYGAYYHTWQYDYKFPLFDQAVNNNIYKSDGTSNMDDPLVRKTLELRYNMENVDKSAVPLSTSISQKLSYRNEYLNQNASMIITGSWMVAETAGTELMPVSFRTVFAPLPRNVNDGSKGYTNAVPSVLVVTKNSPNKDAAYKFMRWYSTKGMDLQGWRFTSWKGADLNAVIDNMLARSTNPEMMDRASLVNTFNARDGAVAMPSTYSTEMDAEYIVEAEKYLLGNQDLQTTLDNLKKKMDAIVASNK